MAELKEFIWWFIYMTVSSITMLFYGLSVWAFERYKNAWVEFPEDKPAEAEGGS